MCMATTKKGRQNTTNDLRGTDVRGDMFGCSSDVLVYDELRKLKMFFFLIIHHDNLRCTKTLEY